MKIIKRYQNRKLYDTVKSKYITLKDVIQMVKTNEEFTVIDRHNREITQRILLSALAENVIIDETTIRNLITIGEINGNTNSIYE